MRNAGNMVGRMATLPLAVPALLANGAIESFRQAVTAPQRMGELEQQYGGDWYAAGRDPRMAAEGLNFAGAVFGTTWRESDNHARQNARCFLAPVASYGTVGRDVRLPDAAAEAVLRGLSRVCRQ